MPTKAQHTVTYRKLMGLLRAMREEAHLTQRELGKKLAKPQSWVFNSETGNRRVDITEFLLWARACDQDPLKAFKKLIES